MHFHSYRHNDLHININFIRHRITGALCAIYQKTCTIKTVLKNLLVINLADLSLSDMRTNYCMVSPLLCIIAWKYSVFLANLLYFILPNYVEDLFKSVPRFELICTSCICSSWQNAKHSSYMIGCHRNRLLLSFSMNNFISDVSWISDSGYS